MIVCFLFVLTLPSQISQTLTGWSGSLTQKTKSLRSFPCEEHSEQFLTVLDSRREIPSSLYQKEKPEGRNIIWRPLEPVQLQWCSQCVSHSVLQPLIMLCIQHRDCLVEAVAGAQDKFCMHIFTYMCLH